MKPVHHRAKLWNARRAKPICRQCGKVIHPNRLAAHRECVSLKLVRPPATEGPNHAA